MNKTQCGFVAIIGRPNVGKSTMLNHLLGKKISITSRKPQTTRHRILGIKTIDETQIMYVDTPGLHQEGKRAINRYMNRTARSTLKDVDIIVFVVDATQWDSQDDWILRMLHDLSIPVILAVNKIDKIKDRALLLPFIEKASKKYNFRQIVPISAKQGDQLEQLEKEIIDFLPENVHFYPAEQITDRSDQFMVTETIREKLMRLLGDEIPYSVTVTIDAFEEEPTIIKIAAVIWIEKPGQKAIVIGKRGDRLKAVGTKAREDLELYFEKKIFLQLWVKVKTGWSDDEKTLQSFGYK